MATATIGGNFYQLEVADNGSEQLRGLSNRKTLEPRGGMLFVYKNNDYHTYWMKDTLIPLQIIWLDEDFHVVDTKLMPVEEDPSHPTASYSPRAPARYAIEISPNGTDVSIGDKIEISF